MMFFTSEAKVESSKLGGVRVLRMLHRGPEVQQATAEFPELGNIKASQVWWHRPLILALKGQRQVDL